jgi:hypothetical protein
MAMARKQRSNQKDQRGSGPMQRRVSLTPRKNKADIPNYELILDVPFSVPSEMTLNP